MECGEPLPDDIKAVVPKLQELERLRLDPDGTR
jgi:hypothetical protein